MLIKKTVLKIKYMINAFSYKRKTKLIKRE
jgi:hypothetical protein